ncbi:MAG TPA: RDD family protein [Candidatus Acidoferrales bacterium]|nr:RDD family protein [Candidatus Acidoferrales bacterium]
MASIGRRALAALVDAVFATGIWFSVFHYWSRYNPDTGQYVVSGLPAIGLFAVTAGYWILTEWLLGGTLGKLVFDLRVVSLKGKRCTLGQSVKRNVLRIVDFIFFYLVGYIVAKLNPLRQRLGDQWAGTIVILQRSSRPVQPARETPQSSV